MTSTKKPKRIALGIMLFFTALGVTLANATTEDNYKNETNLLPRMFESTHTENGYKANIVLNPHATGIYTEENGYYTELAIIPQGIGGSHHENNYQLDLAPEKTFPDILDMHACITDVVPCVDYCLPCPISEAYQAWFVNVTVTAENFITTSATFTVSAYYNDTLIGTQPVNNLPAGQDTNKTFNWNLASVPLGPYTLKANVTLIGDTNPGNDEHVNGQFLVKLDGDVNGNRVVESTDLIFGLAPAIGSFPGDINWNCQADFNFSGSVESGDLIFGFAPYNGQSY